MVINRKVVHKEKTKVVEKMNYWYAANGLTGEGSVVEIVEFFFSEKDNERRKRNSAEMIDG